MAHHYAASRLCCLALCAVAMMLATSLSSTGAVDTNFRMQFQAKLYDAEAVPRWRPERQIKKVLMSYVRRTGGHNIELLMKRYAQDHPHVISQHFIGSPEVMAHQLGSVASREDIVTMITMRHPLERICSMYEFDFVQYHGRKYNSAIKQLIDRDWWKNHPQLPKHDPEAWAAYLQTHRRFTDNVKNTNLWDCISNVYVKTLSGWDIEPLESGLRYHVTWKDFLMAAKVLESYDAVLMTKDLRKNSTKCLVEFALGPVPEIPTPTRGSHPDGYAGPSCMSLMPEEVKAQLEEMNKFDIMLYEHAVDLVNFRMRERNCTEDGPSAAASPGSRRSSLSG